jgi:hypothetical protein
MRKREEYQSKVSTDAGLTRGRIPTPLLVAVGAKVGDYLIFRVTTTGKAIVRLMRAKPDKKKDKQS